MLLEKHFGSIDPLVWKWGEIHKIRFGPKPKAYMMLITGECEYFMSKHNTDMTDAWLRHEYFCIEDEKTQYSMTMSPEVKAGK